MWELSIVLSQIIISSGLEILIATALPVVTFLAGWLLQAYLSNKNTDNKSPSKDITDLEKSPLEELTFLKSIINNSPNIVFVKDTELRIIFANQAFTNIFGKEPEELYGKTDSENGWSPEFVHGNPQKGIRGFEKDDKAVLNGKTIIIPSNYSKLDGQIRYFDTIKMPMRSATNVIIGILGIARDVTERKRLELVQQYNIEFQHLITNLATEFINLQSHEFDEGVNRLLQQIGTFIGAGRTYIYHFSDDLEFASMVYEWRSQPSYTDIETEQNISTKPFQRVFDLFKQGHPDFIPNVADLGADRQVERENLIARGIHSRITLPLFQRGKLIGSMGFHAMEAKTDWADNTVDLLKIVAEIYINFLNRKEVGEKIRYQARLLANVTDAIISTDMDMIITSWNRAAENIYGFNEEEAIGKNFTELLRTDYLGLSRNDVINDFLANQQWRGEIIRYRKDGNPIDVLVSTSGILDANGDMVGAVSVNHDISERKRLEKQQREIALQNERIQLLEEVISDLSHDIKTPLSSIQLSLYMLKKQTNPESQEEYLDRLELHVKHLTKLVEDILTMTRLDKGAGLVLKPLDMNQIVEHITNTYRDVSEMNNRRMLVDLSPNLDPILASEAELGRVFANLIENAINYSPSGKPIVIKTYSANSENFFEVQDQGIGIDENDLPHIFNRFYRADKARDTSKGGTGLGLAITKKLVELHNGSIHVESIPNEGSKFIIKLVPSP